jgi:hypothetical protein
MCQNINKSILYEFNCIEIVWSYNSKMLFDHKNERKMLFVTEYKLTKCMNINKTTPCFLLTDNNYINLNGNLAYHVFLSCAK